VGRLEFDRAPPGFLVLLAGILRNGWAGDSRV